MRDLCTLFCISSISPVSIVISLALLIRKHVTCPIWIVYPLNDVTESIECRKFSFWCMNWPLSLCMFTSSKSFLQFDPWWCCCWCYQPIPQWIGLLTKASLVVLMCMIWGIELNNTPSVTGLVAPCQLTKSDWSFTHLSTYYIIGCNLVSCLSKCHVHHMVNLFTPSILYICNIMLETIKS